MVRVFDNFVVRCSSVSTLFLAHSSHYLRVPEGALDQICFVIENMLPPFFYQLPSKVPVHMRKEVCLYE